MPSSQVCQDIRSRQQGRRPSGNGRVKSAFQLPGKKGGGEGSLEKRNRPGLSVGDTKHGSQRGPEKGRRGLLRARFIPTPARELREEYALRIPLLWRGGRVFHVGAG